MFELDEEVIEETRTSRRVVFPEIGGGYELTYSPILVQALGHCLGVNFSFQAREEHWEFATESDYGHAFLPGDPRHFSRNGLFLQGSEAIEIAQADEIIRQCLTDFWGQR